jgi:1-acyl-sn-glycerol-3-phosphate acyltransferase
MITVKGQLPDGQYIVVANHGSWRDVFVLKYLNWDLKVMAATEVLRWCPILYPLGCFLNRPGGINRSIRIIENGWSLGICPTGWTDLTGEIGKFYTGASVISKLTKTKIVPIRIRYSKYYSKEFTKLPDLLQWIIDGIINPFPDIEVIIGEPLPPGTEAEKLREVIINM